jgi:hypothetical protein
MKVLDAIYLSITHFLKNLKGHAVVQLVAALFYMPECRGFYSH